MSRTHLDPATRRWLARIGRKGGSNGTSEAHAKGAAARIAKYQLREVAIHARRVGLNVHTVRARLARGWMMERALGTPVLVRPASSNHMRKLL